MPVWFNLPFTWCKSLTLQLASPSFLQGWCDTGDCSSFTNSWSQIDPCIWPKDFELWIVSRGDLFHCSFVQSLCALAHWSLLTLFCFPNSGFLTYVLPYRPSSQSLLLTVDTDTFFHVIVSVEQWCLEQSAFCEANWWFR